MADTTFFALTDAFSLIFDGTTDAGKNFTVQNLGGSDVFLQKKATVPANTEFGLLFLPRVPGAVLDITDDIYARASVGGTATLVTDERI